jgi:hypothetical protein
MNKFLGRLLSKLLHKKKEKQTPVGRTEVFEDIRCIQCKTVFNKSQEFYSSCCSDECRKIVSDAYLVKKQNTKDNGKRCDNCSCWFLDSFFVECDPAYREKVYFKINPTFCSNNCKKVYLARKFCLHCKESYREPYKIHCECCAVSFAKLKINWKDYCSDTCRIKAIKEATTDEVKEPLKTDAMDITDCDLTNYSTIKDDGCVKLMYSTGAKKCFAIVTKCGIVSFWTNAMDQSRVSHINIMYPQYLEKHKNCAKCQG